MPGSFTSAAAELRALAKRWNQGRALYRQGVSVVSSPEGSALGISPTAPPHVREALEAVNVAWSERQAKKLTKAARSNLNRQVYELKQQHSQVLPKEVSTVVNARRRQLRQIQEGLANNLSARGGLIGEINRKEGSVSNNKALLILSLGQYQQEVLD